MKFLVFSDWHLDTRDPLGWFGWNEDAFVQKLESAVHRYNPDKIILNGDIFELYRYRKAEIVESYPKLIHVLDRLSVVYIRGNHDAVSQRGLDYYEIHHNGKRVLIIHGHQADFLNGNPMMRGMVRMGMRLVRICSRMEWVRNFYIQVYKKLDTKPLDYRRENDFKYLYYALRLLDRRYDAVIMGHTHQLEDIVLFQRGRKKYYLNTGTCTRGRFQGVFFDTDKWRYQMIDENALDDE